MKWPRCNFIFFREDEPDTRTWCICNRAWGHWIQRMPKGAHMGPALIRLPRGEPRPRFKKVTRL